MQTSFYEEPLYEIQEKKTNFSTMSQVSLHPFMTLCKSFFSLTYLVQIKKEAVFFHWCIPVHFSFSWLEHILIQGLRKIQILYVSKDNITAL